MPRLKPRLSIHIQYRKLAGGQDDLWEEHFKLRREAKNLVIGKRPIPCIYFDEINGHLHLIASTTNTLICLWNEVLEKANSD